MNENLQKASELLRGQTGFSYAKLKELLKLSFKNKEDFNARFKTKKGNISLLGSLIVKLTYTTNDNAVKQLNDLISILRKKKLIKANADDVKRLKNFIMLNIDRIQANPDLYSFIPKKFLNKVIINSGDELANIEEAKKEKELKKLAIAKERAKERAMAQAKEDQKKELLKQDKLDAGGVIQARKIRKEADKLAKELRLLEKHRFNKDKINNLNLSYDETNRISDVLNFIEIAKKRISDIKPSINSLKSEAERKKTSNFYKRLEKANEIYSEFENSVYKGDEVLLNDKGVLREGKILNEKYVLGHDNRERHYIQVETNKGVETLVGGAFYKMLEGKKPRTDAEYGKIEKDKNQRSYDVRENKFRDAVDTGKITYDDFIEAGEYDFIFSQMPQSLKSKLVMMSNI